MSKEIKLRGHVAIVDDEDYERLSVHHWHLHRNPKDGHKYARKFTRRTKNIIYMHRMILNAPKGMQVDHINGNGLDNRKANLRLATWAQNQMNRGMQVNNTSGFKGVSKSPSGKWIAQIGHMGTKCYLGSFSTKEQASAAYLEAAKKLYGDFATV